MNLIMSAMCLMMKGLRLVMKGSLVLNSTRLARFCTALATSFRVRDVDSEGLPSHGTEREKWMNRVKPSEVHAQKLIRKLICHSI